MTATNLNHSARYAPRMVSAGEAESAQAEFRRLWQALRGRRSEKP